MTADGIEACHQTGKSKRNSKKIIVCLINWKHCKCVFVNRKTLKSFNREIIGLPNVWLFINQNLTEYNNELALYGPELKRAALINSTYTINDAVHILQTAYFHASNLLKLYSNFEFSNPTIMAMSLLIFLVITQFNQANELL